MNRMPIPATIEGAPEASRARLLAVQRQFGAVPNLYRLIATSPTALDGSLSLLEALGKGALPAATRERIALAIAELHGCGYCLAAHTYYAKHALKLDEAELHANRAGGSLDPKAAAAVALAMKVTRSRGDLTDADIAAFRAAGHDDAELVELVLHVALNTFTNYLNKIAQTEIDYPIVTAQRAVSLTAAR